MGLVVKNSTSKNYDPLDKILVTIKFLSDHGQYSGEFFFKADYKDNYDDVKDMYNSQARIIGRLEEYGFKVSLEHWEEYKSVIYISWAE